MRKTNIVKFVSIIASVVMMLGLLPNFSVSAICCRKDGFDKSRYTLTGNMAEDVATIAKSQKGRTGAQFGYTEAWCDEFVADCIENAGADSSIVGHGGTVADFEAVMRKKGAAQVSSPKIGDLVFFTYSHVEIVTKVENGVVYCAGGNNGGTGNYKTNNCAGERKLYSTARLYLRPNYPPNSVIVPKGHEMSESEGAGQTISDGDYYIFSAINQNYYMDIKGSDAVASEGTNVYMYTTESNVMPPEHDVWSIVYLGNGFYKIKQKGTNMCLDVNGANLDRGTNVQVWTENNSLAQQWSIIRTDQGYKLQSRCNSFYLDVDGGAFENGTNVHVWENNDTSAQKFGLIPYGPSTGKVIEDGIYSIQSSVDSGYYIDASGVPSKGYSNEANIQVWENNSLNELFKIKYIDGYYEIYEVFSGLALDVWNKNGGDGYLNVNRNVQLYEKNHSRSQRWIIKNVGNNKYTIFSTLSGYCLDLDSGRCSNGNNIDQFWYHGGDNQKWRFVKINLKSPTPTITTLSSSSLKLTWSKVTDAATYRIDRRKSGADAYETIATTKDTTYTDKGLEANTKYWYRVYAVLGSEKSSEKTQFPE